MGSTAEWKGQRNNSELENRTEITQSEKQRENSRVKNKINRERERSKLGSWVGRSTGRL